MAARMKRPGLRREADFPAGSEQPAAEIDVFKPHRIKLLIPAAQLFPRLAAEGEEGPGGLLHVLRLV